MRPAFSAGLLCLLLGGCVTAGDSATQPPQGSLESMLDTTSSLGTGSRPVLAMADIPGGPGKVTNIKQERSIGLQHQEIFLVGSVKGMTPNRIEVLAVRSDAGDVQTRAAALPKPTEGSIRDEIAARFPNLDMQVVAKPMRNANGPFGLAIGKTTQGVRCIYAWQWIDGVAADHSRTSLGTLLHAEPTTAVSLRIDLCRAHATLDGLANAVQRLSIRPNAIDPRGDAVAPTLEAMADGDEAGKDNRAARDTKTTPRLRRAKARHRVRVAHAGGSAGSDPSARSEPAPLAESGSGPSNVPSPTRRLQPPSPVYQDKPAGRASDLGLPPQAYQGPSSMKAARTGGNIDPAAPTLTERP